MSIFIPFVIVLSRYFISKFETIWRINHSSIMYLEYWLQSIASDDFYVKVIFWFVEDSTSIFPWY